MINSQMDNFDKDLIKLAEFIDNFKELVDLSYREGQKIMYNINNRVDLWANRVYGKEAGNQLELCGFYEGFSVISQDDTEEGQQNEYNNDLNRKILGLENLLEDLQVWGEPSKEIMVKTENGFKIGFRGFGYERKKTTQK